MDKTDEIKVNDGRGLYDASGLIDTMIMDCNRSVKELIGGNYIGFCNGMLGIVEKLAVLKNGITKEKDDMQKQIHELRELLEERGQENVAGSVHNALDGAVGSGEEKLRDVIVAESGRLEPDPGDSCT